jgi:GNAT superfamily N-acetyltransferase
MRAFEIKPACARDVPVLLKLIRELAAYERLSHLVTATEEGLRRVLFGERPAAEAVLGWHDGRAMGFAIYFQNFSTFVGRPGTYLEDIYVKPEFRQRGLGEALLRHVARVAHQRNSGRLEWAVLDWNTPAIQFYKKLGAGPLDDWTLFRITGDALQRLAQGE